MKDVVLVEHDCTERQLQGLYDGSGSVSGKGSVLKPVVSYKSGENMKDKEIA